MVFVKGWRPVVTVDVTSAAEVPLDAINGLSQQNGAAGFSCTVSYYIEHTGLQQDGVTPSTQEVNVTVSGDGTVYLTFDETATAADRYAIIDSPYPSNLVLSVAANSAKLRIQAVYQNHGPITYGGIR